ncbi:hypothetical protein BGZ47_007996 [Haplosporangium gracile]|nr:hypothetical protein BGZ47_007996 [Haplosporangium gracile]
MGCRNLWRIFANKKHKPLVQYRRHQRGALKSPDVNEVRIDVQGSIYPTILYAYTHCRSLEAAHSLVHKRIQKLGASDISVLYLDSDSAEKKETHEKREQARSKAFAPRHSLAVYLTDQNWNVVESNTEEDIKIAQVVYPEILPFLETATLSFTVPSSPFGAQYLETGLESIMNDAVTTLGLASRNHLGVLGNVSHNGYSRNIYDLGCATNFKIIQDIPTGMDVPAMVAAYLSDKRAILKNNKNLSFDASIKVFAHREHTPVRPPTDFGTEGSVTTTLARSLDSSLSDLSSTLTLEDVKSRFEDAKKRHTEHKKKEAEARSLSKWVVFTDRRQANSFNRYRIIDRPPPMEKRLAANHASLQDKKVTIDKAEGITNSSTHTTTPQTQRLRY